MSEYNICNDDSNDDYNNSPSRSDPIYISYDECYIDVENPQTAYKQKINAELLHFIRDTATSEISSDKQVNDRTTDSDILETATRTKLQHMFIESNSPISSNNSNSGDSDYELNANGSSFYSNDAHIQHLHEQVDNVLSKRKMNYKKITYEEIERSLSKYYDKNNKYSNEMDILITFMRGQKHIYKESAYFSQMKLYAITITALSITSFITVITPFIRMYAWSIIVISGGNAIATVLITILNFLRFDSARNAFALLSTHYEHFEHTLELTNNKLLFMTNETEQNRIVLDKIKEIEFKMGETKQLCPVIVPEEVKRTFPVICQTNIFSLIKKLETYRKQLMIQFKDIKNEMRYIVYKWNADKTYDETPQRQNEKARLHYLMEIKEKIKKELIDYKDVYNQMDDLFMKEIRYAELNRQCLRVFGIGVKRIDYEKYSNPIIKDHLELIFTQ